MTSPPWFRFYSEALNDRKILRVCRDTQLPKALVIGVWTTILALASDSPRRGLLLFTDDIPLTFADLAIETGIDDGSLDELLSVFCKFSMLAYTDGVYCVANWDKRQFASDHSTARVKEWRERQKENGDDEEESNDDETLECNSGETLQKRCSNGPETEAESETETTNVSQKKRQAARKRSTNTGDSRAMFSALANLCQISLKTLTEKQRAVLNQNESRLRAAGAGPSDVDAFASWWYECDWRGRGDEKVGRPSAPPQPHQVREEWGKFETWQNGRKSAQPKHITLSQ